MKTVIISGSHSNIGKTSLAEELLRSLHNWSALKTTVVKSKSRCPRGSNCEACSELKGDFNIVTNKKIINQENKDTARMKKAGAKRVIWLISNLKGLKAGLARALHMLKDSEGVVIEGTTVLRYINPDLTIYLGDGTMPARPSARDAQKKADLIIDVNRLFR